MRVNRQAGSTLIEALIAITIFSIAIIGLQGLQAATLKSDILSQQRVTATYFGDEIIGLARADAANATCYTVPASGACGNPNGAAEATDWVARVQAALPGATVLAPSVTYGAGGLFTVAIRWQRHGEPFAHNFTVTTDVQAAP